MVLGTGVKPLGTLLTDLGWISAGDLDQALKVQRRDGARIGTCLLEQGAISEERLMSALCHQLGVPAARPSDLRSIPPEVHQLVPSRLALRWQSAPFRMLGDDLHVAMLDVGNLEFHDELAFATGKRVRVYVANEARLYCTLEDYFGHHHPQIERFRRLVDELDGHDPVPRDVLAERPTPPAAPETRVEQDLVTAPIQPIAESLESPPHERGHPRLELDDLESLAEIAERVMATLAPHYRRVLLFKVVRGAARGWTGRGQGLDDVASLGRLEIPLDLPSVFAQLADGAERHLGPLATTPPHLTLAQAWGGDQLITCYAGPARIGRRLAAVLFCDPGPEGFRAGARQALDAASDALGKALGRIALKRRSPNEDREAADAPVFRARSEPVVRIS